MSVFLTVLVVFMASCSIGGCSVEQSTTSTGGGAEVVQEVEKNEQVPEPVE